MYIDPIQLKSISGQDIFAPQKSRQADAGFGDVFKQAWNQAAETQDDLAKKQYQLSIGEIEDTHTVPIAASKAQLSLSLLVNLRNKALEAYNEMMRMSV